MTKIYLDNNATTPLAPTVAAKITEALGFWANPSSNNENAKLAASEIAEARRNLAKLFNTRPDSVIFTSGGTESNNWIIHSAISRAKNRISAAKKPHVITSCIEHPSILEPLKVREENGEIDVTYIAINPQTGQISPSTVLLAVRPETCLVTIMLANNETGVIQPIREIFREIRQKSIILHSDVAQGAGKLSIDLADLQADAITVVGHKFYGPRSGALVLGPEFESDLEPMIYGGGQEMGRRSGTENTPMIVGLGEAARIFLADGQQIENHLREIRDYFEQQLKIHLPTAAHLVHFQQSPRLPNTSSVAFFNYSPHSCDLVERAQTFSASTCAACHKNECSPVLIACGLNFATASKTVRFSFGRQTKKSEIDTVIQELVQLCM
ncbi:unnamed protein product [Caenorhabditis angaria]|uniref:Selenocysteine lyase n=1 Tax=Caenorhabditis angaria TaxID=860376 RepID=A0A9P1I9N2_9PELO|nr:unnamed protein product [Caenorhabditis angaria]